MSTPVNGEVPHWQSELDALNDEIPRLQSELDALSDQVDGMRSENTLQTDALNHEIPYLQSKLDALSDKVDEMKSEMNTLQIDVTRSNTQMNGASMLRDEVAQLSRQKSELRSEFITLKNEFSTLDYEFRTLQDKARQTAKSQEKTLKFTIAKQNSRIVRLEKNFSEQQKELELLKGLVVAHEHTINNPNSSSDNKAASKLTKTTPPKSLPLRPDAKAFYPPRIPVMIPTILTKPRPLTLADSIHATRQPESPPSPAPAAETKTWKYRNTDDLLPISDSPPASPTTPLSGTKILGGLLSPESKSLVVRPEFAAAEAAGPAQDGI